jgi:hypothetical protein
MHAANAGRPKRLRLNGQGSEKSSEICLKRGPVLFCCDYHTRAADFSTTTPSLELLSLEPWADARFLLDICIAIGVCHRLHLRIYSDNMLS